MCCIVNRVSFFSRILKEQTTFEPQILCNMIWLTKLLSHFRGWADCWMVFVVICEMFCVQLLQIRSRTHFSRLLDGFFFSCHLWRQLFTIYCNNPMTTTIFGSKCNDWHSYLRLIWIISKFLILYLDDGLVKHFCIALKTLSLSKIGGNQFIWTQRRRNYS